MGFLVSNRPPVLTQTTKGNARTFRTKRMEYEETRKKTQFPVHARYIMFLFNNQPWEVDILRLSLQMRNPRQRGELLAQGHMLILGWGQET